MSGGSYGYLASLDMSELVERASKDGDIQQMADRLAGLGYASDAARETEELLLTLRQMENRINAMKNRLALVWRAVEWWDSCDCSEDDVKAALERYRGG